MNFEKERSWNGFFTFVRMASLDIAAMINRHIPKIKNVRKLFVCVCYSDTNISNFFSNWSTYITYEFMCINSNFDNIIEKGTKWSNWKEKKRWFSVEIKHLLNIVFYQHRVLYWMTGNHSQSVKKAIRNDKKLIFFF